MKINTAKQKMLKGEVVIGFSMGLASPIVAKYLASSGVDFVMLDTQHGSWGPDSTVMALASMADGTATPMARVAANNFTLIGRLLDEGMLGIIVPMVHTPEDAKAAADACRFPPVGNRSWGWSLARMYGTDYPSWINDQVYAAIQIESAQAVANAEAIMATPGIDGCWVGPADLGLTMGLRPAEVPQSDEHRRALEKVIQACKNTGKVPGIAGTSVEDAITKMQMGFRFVTASNDANLLLTAAAGALTTLRQAMAKL